MKPKIISACDGKLFVNGQPVGVVSSEKNDKGEPVTVVTYNGWRLVRPVGEIKWQEIEDFVNDFCPAALAKISFGNWPLLSPSAARRGIFRDHSAKI